MERETPEEVLERDGFPIMGVAEPFQVKWSTLKQHETQALINHGQNLRRLAHRGGLCPLEVYAICHGKRWSKVREISDEQALEFCRSIEVPRES